MSGAARLEITVGKPESLILEGRAASIERVDTEVRHNTLFIESKPRDWFMSSNRRRITVRISVPRAGIPAGGRRQRRAPDRLRRRRIASSRRPARRTSSPRAVSPQLTVRMAGAGHGDFSRLVADEAKVTVEGVGSVIVHPKDTLDATMNGVGAILYTGSPREVNTRMNGLGTIARKDAKDVEER